MNHLRITSKLLMLLFLLGPMLLLQSGVAQAQRPAQRSAKVETFGGFLAPTGKAMPSRTEGGASRGRCMSDSSDFQQAVQLVLPASNVGLTSAARPTFLAHIDSDSAQQLFFSLKNEDESYFYEMTVTPPPQGGLVAFEMPDSAPALKVGEEYRWSVAVICGSQLGPDSPWASGWVERVEPGSEVGSLPDNMSWAEQASRYGKAGLWYETAAALAQWKAENPQAAESAWNALLQTERQTKLQQKDQTSDSESL